MVNQDVINNLNYLWNSGDLIYTRHHTRYCGIRLISPLNYVVVTLKYLKAFDETNSFRTFILLK